MGELIVLAAVFAVFIPALMLPGPDFVAVVRSSMGHGARAGLLTTLGVSVGLGMYAALSILGLSAILVEYQWLSWAVRLAGGSYLIFLGVRLLRAPPSQIDLDNDETKARPNAFVFGFLVTLTNPKAMVVFASVFATAVTAQTPAWLMALMIALVFASSLAWYSLVSLFMASSPVVHRFESTKHWIERIAGGCFIALGGKLLADARNPITP